MNLLIIVGVIIVYVLSLWFLLWCLTTASKRIRQARKIKKGLNRLADKIEEGFPDDAHKLRAKNEKRKQRSWTPNVCVLCKKDIVGNQPFAKTVDGITPCGGDYYHLSCMKKLEKKGKDNDTRNF